MFARPSHNSDIPVVVPWYHWLWVAPVAMILRLWISSLRFRIHGEIISDKDGPFVILLWHNKLFVAPWITQHCLTRSVTALISTSKDGAWLTAFFKLMGLSSARGSTNRRGAIALVALSRSIRAGEHAGITPDGPKGPALKCKLGAVSLGKLTQRPFLILGIRYCSYWRLKSWDRFSLPKPFSVVNLTFLIEPLPKSDESDLEVAKRIEVRLNDLSND